jgi:endo-1,4-beta-xylanase
LLRFRPEVLAPLALLAAAACAKTPSYGAGAAGASGPGAGGTTGSGGAAAVIAASGLPTSFKWTSTGPLIAPIQDPTHPIVSVKDPSVVYYGGLWHVFATTANTSGNWSMIYLNFADWSQAASAPLYYLDNNPGLTGYHAAPQVFYFAPQQKWYLVFQSGQPQFSKNDDITKPENWTAPTNFFASEPPGVVAHKGSGDWLDFFVICDDARCHLFFADDNGEFFRSDTDIASFPNGFGDAVVAIQGTKNTLFEGDAVYHIKGTQSYLALIEAFGPTGNRYYRSFVAPALDAAWVPLADSWDNPFAGKTNVTFDGGTAWTNDISHGEMIRDGYDQTLEIDPAHLQLLYQGVDPSKTNVDYSQLPYHIGLLTLAP